MQTSGSRPQHAHQATAAIVVSGLGRVARRVLVLLFLIAVSIAGTVSTHAAQTIVNAAVPMPDTSRNFLVGSLALIIALALFAACLMRGRRRVERALARSEHERELFRRMFTLSLDSMCAVTEDACFRMVNPAFSKLLGYSEAELLASPMTDFIVRADRAATLTEVEKLARGSVALDFENRFRCKDGAIRLLSWRAFGDEHSGLIYATARDVTGQRSDEEQLTMLRLAVEQTSHSIVITDLSARIEYVNRAFVEHSGYAAEEVLGQNPRILQSGLTPAADYAEMWRMLKQGENWRGEFHNKRKNGEIFIEAVLVSPVRRPDGRIMHYLAIKEDVTEYKRALHTIHESKILLQRVIDSTPDWIHVKDRDHRFLLVNRSLAEAFKQTPEGMLGRLDSDFMPLCVSHDDAQHGTRNPQRDDAAVFAGQTIHDRCDRIVFEDGSRRVFDTFKGPLRNASDEVYAMLCYRRDITARVDTELEQKALEAQLRQAQKMELIGHLTGGVAHDFNNILASMLGYAELIQMSPAIRQDPDLNQYLLEILRGGARAKELVAQLLSVNKKKENTSDLIVVETLVDEVIKLLRATMPSSISIRAEVAGNLPQARVSAVQLHQILMNLGVNARDAIHGAGTIEIRAERIVSDNLKTCSACQQYFSGDHLVISVCDSGAGIAPSDLLKIFDPFFTTKQVGRGSGLGLSVLHGIVHSADGHIEVRTAPGAGSEFRIHLPARKPETVPLADAPAPDPMPARIRGNVMVVDDEASIVGFMTAFLESLGCRVIGLRDSTEALRVFLDDPDCVDLVITDQTMPQLSGADLARAMLARRPALPIVMSTGYSNAIDEAGARQIGIRRLLAKPVAARVLSDIVAEFLALKSA